MGKNAGGGGGCEEKRYGSPVVYKDEYTLYRIQFSYTWFQLQVAS